MWDDVNCQCRCRPEEERPCGTGFSYDGVFTCSCLPGPPLIASTEVVAVLGVLLLLFFSTTVGLYVLLKKAQGRVSQLRDRPETDRMLSTDSGRAGSGTGSVNGKEIRPRECIE